jgi:adenylate kinase
MNMILLGAPGAGKGTQGELISEKLHIPTISTGNMLREAMRKKTPLGKKIEKYMEDGSLVPDDVILAIIAERIAEPDCANGFILDGVPRTLPQAEAMDRKKIHIDHVISLEVNDDEIAARMSGRRVCPACGGSFHIVNNPPKVDGVCDLCGGLLETRDDDKPEMVKHRLEVYHKSTEVLKNYYAAQGKLRIVYGNQSIEQTHRDILRAIGETV